MSDTPRVDAHMNETGHPPEGVYEGNVSTWFARQLERENEELKKSLALSQANEFEFRNFWQNSKARAEKAESEAKQWKDEVDEYSEALKKAEKDADEWKNKTADYIHAFLKLEKKLEDYREEAFPTSYKGTMREQLAKAEQELEIHKNYLSIEQQISKNNFADLESLIADVKPLLEALKHCYDVVEWPGPGQSSQQSEALDSFLAAHPECKP